MNFTNIKDISIYMENNWITHSRELVFENPWLELYKHDVTDHGGKPGTYTTVEFRTKAVGIVPIDDEGNTWLVGQYRYPLKEYSWEIPEGGVPHNEDLLEGAVRELKEEVGLTADNWQHIMEFNTSNSCTNEVAHIFIARNLTLGENDLESTEADMKVKKLPFEEAFNMVMSGQIKDSLSVAAILKVKFMLK